MADEREIVCWDCNPDREQLSYSDIQEAVVAWADEIEGPLPATVTVYGWARMELPPAASIARDLLEWIYERTDEELGNPDGGSSSDPTPDALKAAALQFASTFRDEYEPWMCETVEQRVVRVADYVPASWLVRSGSEDSPS